MKAYRAIYQIKELKQFYLDNLVKFPQLKNKINNFEFNSISQIQNEYLEEAKVIIEKHIKCTNITEITFRFSAHFSEHTRISSINNIEFYQYYHAFTFIELLPKYYSEIKLIHNDKEALEIVKDSIINLNEIKSFSAHAYLLRTSPQQLAEALELICSLGETELKISGLINKGKYLNYLTIT